MGIEKAISINTIENILRELEKIKPRGTGIRARNVKGLVVKNSEFIGLETALDASNSQDITWERNLVDNFTKYSELPNLLKPFLTEARKQKPQADRSVLIRIKDQILQRWPELAGTSLAIAMMRIIEYFM